MHVFSALGHLKVPMFRHWNLTYMFTNRSSRLHLSYQSFNLHHPTYSMFDAGSKQFPEVLHDNHIGYVKGQSPASLP